MDSEIIENEFIKITNTKLSLTENPIIELDTFFIKNPNYKMKIKNCSKTMYDRSRCSVYDLYTFFIIENVEIYSKDEDIRKQYDLQDFVESIKNIKIYNFIDNFDIFMGVLSYGEIFAKIFFNSGFQTMALFDRKTCVFPIYLAILNKYSLEFCLKLLIKKDLCFECPYCFDNIYHKIISPLLTGPENIVIENLKILLGTHKDV